MESKWSGKGPAKESGRLGGDASAERRVSHRVKGTAVDYRDDDGSKDTVDDSALIPSFHRRTLDYVFPCVLPYLF